MSTKHTPAPWRVSVNDPTRIVAPADGFGVATTSNTDYYRTDVAENAANARFIVRAVNSHADLLAALQMVCDSGVALPDGIERAMLNALNDAYGAPAITKAVQS